MLQSGTPAEVDDIPSPSRLVALPALADDRVPSAHDRDSYWTPARLHPPVNDEGLLGSLSLVGLVSLCCLGLGGLAAGAALAGGGAGTTVLATGATDARGAVVSALVTFLTVVVVALFARWRLG
ncbi:hypothetical protein JCM17823_16790 [Halorubrum gandharaense]